MCFGDGAESCAVTHTVGAVSTHTHIRSSEHTHTHTHTHTHSHTHIKRTCVLKAEPSLSNGEYISRKCVVEKHSSAIRWLASGEPVFVLIVLIYLYHIFGNPVLDLISHETGLIVYNRGHSKGDKAWSSTQTHSKHLESLCLCVCVCLCVCFTPGRVSVSKLMGARSPPVAFHKPAVRYAMPLYICLRLSSYVRQLW